jgi:hypothetical protein
MKIFLALLVAASVIAASPNNVREVPHSEKSEAIFLYYQKHKPSPTTNPFNGSPQEFRA